MYESSRQWVSSAALAAAGLALWCGPAQAQESLCQPGEPVVFACHTGSKTVSLCRPSALAKELTYRFGTPATVELAYPPAGKRLRAPFTVSTAPLAGGAITTVTFRRGQYQYGVYSKVGRSDGAPLFEDGVIVSRRGKEVAKLVCDDGGEGFRERLDWLPVAER
ncbi:MAG TPA: hypothetical protein VF861_03590 [Telluria sp.]